MHGRKPTIRMRFSEGSGLIRSGRTLMARSLRICSSFVAAFVLLGFTTCALAQTSTVAPRTRIVSPIVDSDAVTFAGNVHRLARPEFDRGVLSDETRLERMVLLL